MVALSKFGLNNAAVRFFEESKSGKGEQSLPVYYSTLFIGSVVIAGLICLIFASSLHFLGGFLPAEIISLLLFSTVIVFLDAPRMTIINFLRAAQRTKLVNSVNVLATYVGIALSIFFVFFCIRGLYGFYFGKMLAIFVTFIALAVVAVRANPISFQLFSAGFLKQSIKYGLPLMGFELCNHILAYLDRYLIQYFLGSGPLGIYAAGYNLCSHIGSIVTVPLSLVIIPLLMDVWVNEGKETTQRFLSSTLRYFLLVIFPIAFGFIALSQDLITGIML